TSGAPARPPPGPRRGARASPGGRRSSGAGKTAGRTGGARQSWVAAVERRMIASRDVSRSLLGAVARRGSRNTRGGMRNKIIAVNAVIILIVGLLAFTIVWTQLSLATSSTEQLKKSAQRDA